MTLRMLALPIVVLAALTGCSARENPQAPEAVRPSEDRRPVAEVAPPPREVENIIDRVFLDEWLERVDPDEVRTDLGVELRTKVRLKKRTAGHDIEIEWNLRYTGKRQPLVILEPSLTNETEGQTWVKVYALAPGADTGRIFTYGSPPSVHRYQFPLVLPFGENWFITVLKGQSATGTVHISIAEVKSFLVGRYPVEFSAAVTPRFYVEFEHKPWDRGRVADLDAWTGMLRSPLLVVPEVKNW